MEEKAHIVDFEKYCPECKHYDKKENEQPCDQCLGISARMNSRKPERWEERDGRRTS